MSCLSLLLLSPLLASPYQEARDRAEASGRLAPGDTAVLVGLAGEHGCTASHDPEDCAALRAEPVSDQPLLELVPVPAVLVPAMGGQAASLLLPRFPYGLGEPVTPLLGPWLIHEPKASWVRLSLPEQPPAPAGHGEATLLVSPDPAGPILELVAEPAGPPEHERLGAHSRAAAWPRRPLPYTGTQVLLPLLPAALHFEGDAEPVSLSWSDEPPELLGQALADPAWRVQAEETLSVAAGLCMRAYYARTLSRAERGGTVAPREIEGPRLVVLMDATGQVAWAAPLNAPWTHPEAAGCLQANARLLPPLSQGAGLALLEISLPKPPAPQPADPQTSSR
jgi:hypothetical protein